MANDQTSNLRRKKATSSAGAGLSLVKHLVSAGIGSRRACAAMVMAGSVSVNGKVAESLTMPVKARDEVMIGGKEITRPTHAGAVYLMVNKPPGYLSTVRDDRGRKTVMELVPEGSRVGGLVPAGRLDLPSRGLMLLTNDGDLVNQVTHPSYGVPKEYHVTLDAVLTPADVKALLIGVELDEGKASAVSVTRLDDGAYRYRVVLVEGKKREIRMMMRVLGRHVKELKRVRMGELSLGNLAEGKARVLSASEVRSLTVSLRGDTEAAVPQSRRGGLSRGSQHRTRHNNRRRRG